MVAHGAEQSSSWRSPLLAGFIAADNSADGGKAQQMTKSIFARRIYVEVVAILYVSIKPGSDFS